MEKQAVRLILLIFFCHTAVGRTDQDTMEHVCSGLNLQTELTAMTLEYSFHKLFETALYENTENIFNIRQGGFTLMSGSKLACIPVTYTITINCTSEDCSNQTCSYDGSKWPFLWSQFDTTDVLGKIFLHYAIYGLRVFGFDWERECDAYQTPINITLPVPGPVPENNAETQLCDMDDAATNTAAVCIALRYITTLLPTAANMEEPMTELSEIPKGYARTWYEDAKNRFRTQSGSIVHSVAGVVAIVAEIIMISLMVKFYNVITHYISSKQKPYYYYFWAIQTLVIVLLLILLPIYLSSNQNNIAIPPFFYLITITIDFTAALLVCLVFYVHDIPLLPVPFTSWLCCPSALCCKCNSFCEGKHCSEKQKKRCLKYCQCGYTTKENEDSEPTYECCCYNGCQTECERCFCCNDCVSNCFCWSFHWLFCCFCCKCYTEESIKNDLKSRKCGIKRCFTRICCCICWCCCSEAATEGIFKKEQRSDDERSGEAHSTETPTDLSMTSATNFKDESTGERPHDSASNCCKRGCTACQTKWLQWTTKECNNFTKRFGPRELQKNCSCMYIWKWLLHLTGLTLTFFLVSYVLQSIPNVLIAYYAFPTRSLVRLSFFQVALVCLIVTVASLIYLLEKLGWLCYVSIYKKAPDDIRDFHEVVKSEVIKVADDDDDDDVVSVELGERKGIELQKPCSQACVTVLQIMAILIVLSALSLVIYVIGAIVFAQTTLDSDTALQEILTILPTVVLNIIFFATRRRLFDVQEDLPWAIKPVNQQLPF